MSLFGAGIGGSALGRVLVEVGLDARPLEAGMAKTKGQVATGATGIGKTFSTAIKAGAILAGAAVIKFGSDSVKAFLESEDAGLKLGNTLKNNAKLSDVSTQSWADQSHALQELTGIQDELITVSQAMLGQFDLTGSQVQELMPLIVDLSQKMGIDLETAVKAVGKATDGNTGSLQRYGIAVDKGKDGIAEFGDVVSALQGKVGGFSESISGTFRTRMAVLAANFDDIKEKVGQALIPVLEGLAGVLSDMMPVISFAASHWRELLLAFLAFKAVSFLPGFFGKLNFALNGLGTASTVTGKAVQGLATFFTGASTALTTLGLSLSALNIAIAAHAKPIEYWKDQVDQASGSQEEWNRIVQEGASAGRFAGAKTAHLAETYLEQAGATSAAANAAAALYYNDYQVGRAAAEASGPVSKLRSLSEELAAAHDKAADAARNQRLQEMTLAGGLLGIKAAQIQAADSASAYEGAQRKLNTMQANGKQGTKEYRQAVKDLDSAHLDALTSALGLKESVRSYLDQIRQGKRGTDEGRAALLLLEKQLGGTKGSFDSLIGSTDREISRLAAFQQMLDRNDGREINVTFRTTYVESGPRPHGGIQ